LFIESLWLPAQVVDEEQADEARALHAMRQLFIDALSGEPSGKSEGLLQLTKETQQLLAALNPVAVDREKLREIEWGSTCGGTRSGFCPACLNPVERGHASDCWLGNLLKEAR